MASHNQQQESRPSLSRGLAKLLNLVEAGDVAQLRSFFCESHDYVAGLMDRVDGLLPVHKAAREGASFSVVEMLLEAAPRSLLEVTKDGNETTLLHLLFSSAAALALAPKAVELIKKAVSASSAPTCCNRDTKGPLDSPHRLMGLSAADELLLYGQQDKRGRTPLHEALVGANAGDAGALALLEQFPRAASVLDEDGAAPLHLAMANCHKLGMTVFEKLVEVYPDALGVRDVHGRSPLHYACANGAPALLLALCLTGEWRGTAALRDGQGHMPLHLLLSSGTNVRLEAVKLLLSADRDALSSTVPGGVTAFALACSNPIVSPLLVEALLLAAPGIERVGDERGKLPLHRSAAAGLPDAIIGLLLNAWPESLMARDSAGATAFHYRCGSESLVNGSIWSLAYEGALCHRDSEGRLPVHYACGGEHVTVAGLATLLECKPTSVFDVDQSGAPACLGLLHRGEAARDVLELYLRTAMDLAVPPSAPQALRHGWVGIVRGLRQGSAQHPIADACLVDCISERSHEDAMLGFATGSDGQHAVAVASAPVREAFLDLMSICKRYELRAGRPEHASATSIVYMASDKDDSMRVVAADGSSSRREVAIKFMKNRNQWERELAMRTVSIEAGCTDVTVCKPTGVDEEEALTALPVERYIDCTRSARLLEVLGARNLQAYPYMLVMPAADRSLAAIIASETASSLWQSQLRQYAHHLTRSLAKLHGTEVDVCLHTVEPCASVPSDTNHAMCEKVTQNVVHGDVKPRNALRVGDHLRLIDMDASVAVGAVVAEKRSTAYVPPEIAGALLDNSELPRASKSLDAWALGAVLFEMLTGQTLFHADASDNLADPGTDMAALAGWSDELKASRLLTVPDPAARRLLSDLLQREPTQRPDLAAALAFHRAFFEGSEPQIAGGSALERLRWECKRLAVARDVSAGFKALLAQCSMDDLLKPDAADGRVPLHDVCAAVQSAGVAEALLVLGSAPQAAALLTGANRSTGESPLHLLCRGAHRRIDEKLFARLVEASPDCIWYRDPSGATPLELLLRNPSPNLAAIELLLTRLICLVDDHIKATDAEAPTPAGAETSAAPVDKRPGSPTDAWVQAIAAVGTMSGATQVANVVCKLLAQRAEAMTRLAYARHSDGRYVLQVAAGTVRQELRKRLFLFARFELDRGAPKHASSTSVVYLAYDHNVSPPARVALKFMRDRTQWRREIDIRAALGAAEPASLLESARQIGVRASPPTRPPPLSKSATLVQHEVSPHVLQLQFAQDLSGPALLETLASCRSELTAYPHLLVMAAVERSLASIIASERQLSGWAEQSLAVVLAAVKGLASLHARSVVHADIKPRNIMRRGVLYMLIDLDASVKAGSPLAEKRSTAYVPPEVASVLLQRQRAAKNAPERNEEEIATQFPLPDASYPMDAWALGAVLFEMLTGQTLFHADAFDNLADPESDLPALDAWSDVLRNQKLSQVEDDRARHLLSLLLYRDPNLRPALDTLTKHGFFTGTMSLRDATKPPAFDVFLSYRQASDTAHVKELAQLLAAAGYKVWWDALLETGKDWTTGFCEGLAQSRVFVPLISRGAINAVDKDGSPIPGRNWSILTTSSRNDNVLLEHRLARELQAQGLLQFVVPLMFGDFDEAAGTYGDWWAQKCAPAIPHVTVVEVEKQLATYLDKMGMGTSLLSSNTGAIAVDCLYKHITLHQGEVIVGRKDEVFAKMVARITSPLTQAPGVTSPAGATSDLVSPHGFKVKPPLQLDARHLSVLAHLLKGVSDERTPEEVDVIRHVNSLAGQPTQSG